MAPARAAPAPPLPLPLPLLLALALPLALALVAGQAAAAAVAPRADLNEKCESSEDCVIDHSWCSDNTCKCEENFVEIDPTKCLPQVGYDEKCEDTQQCLHLTPKQTPTLINCAFGTCRCPTGSHYRAKTCWVSSNLGNPCTNDNQCYPEYSSCQGDAQNMQCKCIAGYEEQDSECVVEVPHCELIPGTTEEEGKCVCIDPDAIIITINNNKECVTEAFGGINEPCVQDIQCQLRMGDGAVCAERTKLCSCASGYHYLHGVCWRSAGYGEECTADAECVGHGEWDAYACVHNACACAPDAVAKRPGAQPLCRRIARENEECESKLDCIEGLECGNPTSDSRGTYCYQSTSNRVFNTSTYRMSAAAGPRGECGENEVWTESGSKCVCARGFFRLSSAAPCTPELGESCRVGTVNPDIPHSLCRRSAKFPYVPPASDEGAAATGEEGVWSCSGGYAPGPDNRNCHETQVFRSKCTLDIQCGYYGGRCIGSKCICAEEYVYIADRQLCWPTSGLEESCISNEVCSVGAIGTVECDFSGSTDDHPEGICVCKNGFHAADGDCREDAESLGDPCIGANDCVFAEGDLSVTCTDGQCACREGYVQHSPTICIPEITIKCELIPGAIEENGECVCEDRDYVIDGSRSKCIISALDGAGAACEESAQCLLRMGQGAGCVGGACACLEGFHYLHGECWPTKGFGDACSHDAECYQYAESDAYACVNGHCACAADASGRRPEPNPICRRNAREGEECESTLDCVDNLICDKPTANALDSICQEASRLSGPQVNSTANPASGSRGRGRWSEAQRQQLVAPAEGDGRLVCGLHEQLTPSQTACMCQRGYYRPTSNSECVPELGEPCFVGDDASIPHVEYASCRRSAKLPPAATQRRADEAPAPDGVWACMGGFVPAPSNRECEKTRQNAFNCQVNAQCGYFGGICNVRSCSCESKYHYVSDKFICWPTQGLHEECESDIDCSVSTANSIHCEIDSSETENPSEPEGLAVKTKGICDCKSGYYPVSGDCRKEAYKLTDSCVGAEDCRFAKDDPTISCVSRQCSCVYGYFPFNETACQVGVGGRCARTPDCEHVANAECLDGECTCRTGFVRGGADKCLPVATEYGEECEEDDQCAPLTPGQSTIYCDSVCSCWPNMHYHNNGCWSTKYLDQKCGHQSECIVENSVCRNNYCTCDYGFVDDGSNGCVNGSPVSVVGQSVFSLMLVVLASRFL